MTIPTLTELRELEKRATLGVLSAKSFDDVAKGKTILAPDNADFIAALVNWFRSGAIEELERDYSELILAVGNKYPNETRHQTALRYIRNAEQSGPATTATVNDAAELRKERK